MFKKFGVGLLLLAAVSACKNDQKVREEAQEALTETQSTAGTVVPKEESYQKASSVEELLGTYVTSNYPDKGLWKKVTITSAGGTNVYVNITGNPMPDGRPSCRMEDTGFFRNGRIEIPIEKKEDMRDEDRTLMLLQLKGKDNLALRSKGTREQYWVVLSLFCNMNTTLADDYKRIEE